ncbi:RecE family exodeoxyribonuclease [Salmonella enterica]|nr:RecE family exodeoxyribonuclease [Salmonella enterica]
MSGLLPYFVNLRAKVKSGLKDVVFWISAKSDARALREMENALEDADIKRSAFFKDAVITGLPVYNDLPQEGELDFTWCERYAFSDDTGTWLPIAPAQPEPAVSDNASISEGDTDENATDNTDSGDTTSAASADAGTTTAATDSDSATSAAGSANAAANTSTEGVGTETATTATDELPAWEFNVNGERMADVEKEMLQPVVGMDDRHRILSQFILEDKFSHNITPEQLAEVSRLELDVSDNYIQDMLLATRNAPAIHKLNTPDLWKYTDSFKKVFVRDKRHPLSRMINFNQAYADAHPIDRGLLVKEWIKGNYVSRIEKSGTTSDSASATPESQKTSATKADVAASDKPATKTTYKAIDIRIGRALAKGAVTYPITARDVEQGKAIVEADGEEFKRWSATYRITENIQFYDEKTHIEMIRQAPREVVTGSPELRRAYVDNYLSAYGTLDPDQMVYMPKRAPVDHKENMERVRKAGKNLRDMAAGRFQHEEETQQTGALADEPAAPETVEPDANEHHPDTRSMATESSVAVVDDGEQALREKFGEQLAAERGDFVPGISDPSDPKWVHNDYSASASNEGEKTENEDADEVNQNDDTVIQNTDSVNHSEPSADQIEPEVPETEPKSLQPEPVTKVADGVFDVSAFFATTSNQGEKTETPLPNNDDRSQECAEEKATDVPATVKSFLHEIVRLQSINNQLLEACIAYQIRAETRHERFLEALFYGITRFAYQWVEGEEDRESEEKLRGDS